MTAERMYAGWVTPYDDFGLRWSHSRGLRDSGRVGINGGDQDGPLSAPTSRIGGGNRRRQFDTVGGRTRGSPRVGASPS